MHRATLTWGLLLAVAGSGIAQAATVELEPGLTSIQVGPHTEYLAERDGRRLTIQQVRSTAYSDRFKPSASDVPSFGFVKDAYWFRFRAQNRAQQAERFLLEISYPVLDHIEYYVEKDDGHGFAAYTVGDAYPHGNKIIRHYNFVLPLALGPGQSKWVYLRVRTNGSMQVPLDLWSVGGFVESSQDEQLFYGLLFGFLLVMVFYNLFLYLSIRDRSYLYYVLFVLSCTLYEGSVLGLAQELLWPGSPWMAEKGYIWFGLTNTAMVMMFAGRFIDLRHLAPSWNRAAQVYVALCGAGILAAIVAPYRVMVQFLALWAGLGVILVLVVSIVALFKGMKSARYYLAAWAVFLLGIFLFIADKFDIVPRSPLTENGHLVGLVLNTVLLSLALADRINLLRAEKEQVQQDALAVQRQAAETLEHQVEKRTQEVQSRSEELEQAYESLAEHDRLKSRFFSNVSHEVRTPLTLILAPLQRLLGGGSGDLPEGVEQKLRAMYGNTQRLLRQINQLLDFSRIESGGQTVSFEPTDIGPVVASIVRSFESFAQGKGVKLGVERPASLPEVYVDPPKLDKVVSNLVSNACKFTEPGGKVMVRLAADEGSLTIAVTDTGIGIPTKELAHVFERFHQVDSGASRRHEGSGIGLALSKELVTLLGGDLSVESQQGMGATFTVTLPLGTEHIADRSQIRAVEGRSYAPAVAEEAAGALAAEAGWKHTGEVATVTAAAVTVDTEPSDPTADAEPTPTADETGPPLVLVVEDNPEMRRLVCEICEQSFSVIEASDGQQALKLIGKRRPALVISDIMMPVMDGYELVRRLRAEPKTEMLPVLLLTAKAGPEMLVEGLDSGANDYLAKPFESQELLARARNLIRLERQERKLRGLSERLQEQVVDLAGDLERARMLGRYVSPALVRSIMEQGDPVQVAHRRQQLTVFLLRLRDFDKIAETLEPEEMTAMLNGYLSSMMDVALSHGATVDQLNQDLVGGFFGAPTSDGVKQDALRCARMAQEMWQRGADTCREWVDGPLTVAPKPTLVVVSGYATVGNFGSTNRLEYTAVGGAMSKARALLPLVKPGGLVCSRSTWSLIKDELDGQESVKVTSSQFPDGTELYNLSSADDPDDETVDALPPSMSLDMAKAAAAETEAASSDTGRSGKSPAGETPSEVTPSQGPDHLRSGTVLGQRYAIEQKLGQGGMGVVYKARDLKLASVVALKLIAKEQGNAVLRERLYREVKLARLVSHRNVARIYDLGEWRGGEFITMEYIEGETLAQRLSRRGAVEPAAGIDILRQICAGLAAAHLAGIVHRDLKLPNVMLDPSGRAVILDFGIARWSTSVDESVELTQGTLGTPMYMAPEQFSGNPPDARTDIYALGCLCYGLFTGRKPFKKGDMAHMCYQHTQVMPTAAMKVNPQIPPRLSAIIMRCLNKKPADRFDRADEIVSLLETCQAELDRAAGAGGQWA